MQPSASSSNPKTIDMQPKPSAHQAPMPPLCVDLDGTLVNTDIFLENLLLVIKKEPKTVFLIPFWILRGKSYLKYKVMEKASINYKTLPYNKKLIYFLKKRAAKGQKLMLVTGSTQEVAKNVADHVGIFSEYHSSHKNVNLTGKTKAFFLNKYLGKGNYDYVGNSSVDLEIWKYSRTAYVVNANKSTCRAALKANNRCRIFNYHTSSLKIFAKALRPHQWLKNLLVFAPMVFANQFDLNLIFKSFLAFMAFSLVASSGYVFNDLLDVNSDRNHATKKKRPFASGALSVRTGILLIPGLLGVALLLSSLVNMAYLGVILGYFLLTVNYTLWIKKVEVADVLILASFYSLRLYAGSLATDIPLSTWLLAFTTFLFLSLALIKRSSELIDKIEIGGKATLSRGYKIDDHPLLRSLGSTSGYLAVVILALYVSSDEVTQQYAHPQFLWWICFLLMYWISRFWIIANRGQVDYDPVMFAAKDRVTHVVALCAAIFWILARGF